MIFAIPCPLLLYSLEHGNEHSSPATGRWKRRASAYIRWNAIQL